MADHCGDCGTGGPCHLVCGQKTEGEKILMAWWFFVLTLVLEAPVVWLGYRKGWKKAVLPFLLLNLFTWPLLHYLLLTTDIDINWLEAGVALTEGVVIIYWWNTKRQRHYLYLCWPTGLVMAQVLLSIIISSPEDENELTTIVLGPFARGE
jgi:hypothetical protein